MATEPNALQQHFESVAEELQRLLVGGEGYTCSLLGEESDFVRLNRGRVRQAGSVLQREISVDLIQGQRHATASCNLSGDLGRDRDRLGTLIGSLRARIPHLEPDPYLYFNERPQSSFELRQASLPSPERALETIEECAAGLDLVGIWACGHLYRGFANSLGQRNWLASGSFHFDWSLYAGSDKAVKCSYAGHDWQGAELGRKMQEGRRQLEAVSRRPTTIRPGRYRAYLAPSALQEILGMLAWGGFGLKSQRTKQTPLIKMIEEDQRLSPMVGIAENHVEGFAPRFTSSGFITPERVVLIDEGRYREALAGPRSAKEFGVAVNAAADVPQSLDMAGGTLRRDQALAELGTGLYLNNLWYCNYSDRKECRITGMTRFACFWVEEGEIRAPIEVMRFDESVYHMLGDGLLALTAERECLLDPDTYHHRSLSSVRLPGALIEDLTLTL